MFKTTEDLRNAMVKLYDDIEAGKVTNSQARTRAYVAKTIVDTLKVEITAAALGKNIDALAFTQSERQRKLRAA